jgi:hypothetical protein
LENKCDKLSSLFLINHLEKFKTCLKFFSPLNWKNLRLESLWENGFCKVKKLFCKVDFFPAKFLFAQKDFPFPKYQKKIWREKNQLCKKVFLLSKKGTRLKISMISRHILDAQQTL